MSKRSHSRLSVNTATSASRSVGSVPKDGDTWVPPDAAEPDLCPNDLRHKIFPIEILFMFASYTVIYYSYFSQQYYFQNVMRRNLVSYLPTNESICINQTYVTHLTSNATYINLQKDVNEINMVSNIISFSLSAIVSLFLGPLSDIYGRRPVILYILLGALISAIVQIFITYFNADARYYFLVALLNGGSGGFLPLLHICFASVIDITKSVKWRTVRMGILESFVNLSNGLASLTIFFMMPYVKCVFSIPVWLMFASAMLSLLYLVVLPEPLRKVPHERPSNDLKSKFLRLFIGLKLYISPKCLGWNKWACLCLTTLLIAIYGMVIIGEVEILTYFVQNKPLEWDYQHIGIFSAAIALGNWICLCGVFPILVAMGFSNPVICLISSVCGMGTCVGMALLTKDWEMYLAAALQGMTYLGFPALRSIMSQTISSENIAGAKYATIKRVVLVISVWLTFMIQNIIIIFVPLDNDNAPIKPHHPLWGFAPWQSSPQEGLDIDKRPESLINGHIVDTGIVFWIMAGFWALSIPLIVLLMVIMSITHTRDVLPEVQPLLPDISYSRPSSEAKL